MLSKSDDSTLSLIAVAMATLLVAPTAGAAEPRTTIRGDLRAVDACEGKPFQVWLSQERTLVQQVEVPVGGTFSFDVVPGAYTLFAKNEKECVVRSELKAESGHETRIRLDVNASKRKPAESLAGCMCVQAAGCPCTPSGTTSGNFGGRIFTDPSYLFPPMIPPWTPMAAFYRNFYYPGPWNYFGLNGLAFPGGGNMTLAKPNVYVSGPAQTKMNFALKWKEPTTTWLSSVPAYDSEGWNVTLDKNGSLTSDSTPYRYLYYDLRTNDTPLQNERGYCGTRNEMLQKMMKQLEDLGFKKDEVRDFGEHWNVKMRPDDVCVFPQSNTELDKLVKLEISPAPTRVVRILFVITDQKGMGLERTGKWVKAPVKDWIAPATKRLPSSQSLEVREWGVGYTIDPKTERPTIPSGEKSI
jgi:hypothetical protein